MNRTSEDLCYFTIVGAQRCGTTLLYHLLNEHPDIEMNASIRPEPKFFLQDNYFENDIKSYLDHHFNPIQSNIKCIGEKSTSYLEFEYVANRIKTFFCGSKIIVILRNPVYRAISNYQFSVANGLENRDPKTALNLANENFEQLNDISVNPFAYLSRGFYIKYITEYLKEFNSDLKVLIFEELNDNVQKVQELYTWLGVDNTFVPSSINKKINASPKIEISNNLRAELKALFRDSIISLEDILNINLEIWK